MPKIEDAHILIMATNGFEQSELEVPLHKLKEAGADVDVASPDGGEIRGWQHKDWGNRIESDLEITDVDVEDYDALVLPGGVINPDILRTNDDAVNLVREFVDSGKVVAAICHGPWMLVQADAVRGRDVTSWKSVRKDLENAGGNWMDKDVVTDNGIITSRSPADLDAFVAKIIEEVREGRHSRREAAE